MNHISTYIEKMKFEIIEGNFDTSLTPNTVTIMKKNISEISVKDLVELVKNEFENHEGRKFIVNPNSEAYLYTLADYFLQKENFFKSSLLMKVANHTSSFNKGLCIIGNTGVGKTALLKAFESVFFKQFHFSPTTHFRSASAIDVVNEFEKLESPPEREEFYEKYNKGSRFFDDVKAERVASNFGKVNLFEQIFLSRDANKAKTIITCNYHNQFHNNFEMALNEFGEKYGPRVYDRLFSNYNFIVLQGNSFRGL